MAVMTEEQWRRLHRALHRAGSEAAAWVTYYETRLIEDMSDRWPVVLVEKWERNDIGERRFVESRQYVVIPPADGR